MRTTIKNECVYHAACACDGIVDVEKNPCLPNTFWLMIEDADGERCAIRITTEQAKRLSLRLVNFNNGDDDYELV